jgi:hypothetical protein
MDGEDRVKVGIDRPANQHGYFLSVVVDPAVDVSVGVLFP